jgi:predicted RNA-binding Zn-ribbon protein involved in translation (DUF1610 family)
MMMTDPHCTKCSKTLQYLEEIEKYDFNDLLTEVKGNMIVSPPVPKMNQLIEAKPVPKVEPQVPSSTETVTMWHCPKCKVNNDMERERCSICRQ